MAKISKGERKRLNPGTVYPVGTQVVKFSGKPFKSGAKVATIKEIVEHPYKIDAETGKGVTAYTFVEDDSIVSAYMVTKFNS